MVKKEFPIKGHCLSTNPIIVNYLKDNFERFQDSVYSKRSTGVAWNENKWWYISRTSSTPKYDPHVIINIITEINKMNNPSILTGTLTTSSSIMSNNSICIATTPIYTTPTYKPNDYLPNNIWIDGVNIGTIITESLVTEPTKLRIKCQNLKKNLKVSLLQINLK